jgi:hypothetical protein
MVEELVIICPPQVCNLGLDGFPMIGREATQVVDMYSTTKAASSTICAPRGRNAETDRKSMEAFAAGSSSPETCHLVQLVEPENHGVLPRRSVVQGLSPKLCISFPIPQVVASLAWPEHVWERLAREHRLRADPSGESPIHNEL